MSTTDSPIRIAVIGSGPAGFYAAGHLLKDGAGGHPSTSRSTCSSACPRPGGSCAPASRPTTRRSSRSRASTRRPPRTRAFASSATSPSASTSRARSCSQHYHAIVYATGTPVDRPLGIPGEELPGSHAATEFVGWYNGHPDHTDLEVDLRAAERAVVIGNGNVAIDVARMLVLAPSELAPTDTADHALEVLAESRVSEVVIVGRRGPAQAAFTNPELLELGELADADVIVDPAELDARARRPRRRRRGKHHRAAQRRDPALLRRAPARGPPQADRPALPALAHRAPARRPTAISARSSSPATSSSPTPTAQLRARATGERETIAAGLVFRAIGYRGVPSPASRFDARRGVIPNEGGRVLDAARRRRRAAIGGRLRGEYVVGWIKRGPSGVIGTNKKDAQETVDAILADAAPGGDGLNAPASPDGAAVERLLRERQPELVTYDGWASIDRHERSLGESSGRPRVKLTRIEEMLRVAGEDRWRRTP